MTESATQTMTFKYDGKNLEISFDPPLQDGETDKFKQMSANQKILQSLAEGLSVYTVNCLSKLKESND